MNNIIPLLYLPAKKAGIPIPKSNDSYVQKAFPHWHYLVKCYNKCKNKHHYTMVERIEIAKRIKALTIESLLNDSSCEQNKPC